MIEQHMIRFNEAKLQGQRVKNLYNNSNDDLYIYSIYLFLSN